MKKTGFGLLASLYLLALVLASPMPARGEGIDVPGSFGSESPGEVGTGLSILVSASSEAPVEIWPDYWTVDIEPSCEEPGSQYRVSSLGTIQNEPIPALGHAFGGWETVTPATYEAPGLEQRVCAHDKAHVETREIPVLPIVWGEWEPVTPATCEMPGLERRVNTLDADKVEEREVAALGHDFGAWETVTPATYEAPGLEQRVCAHDKAHVETREIPVLPIVWGEWEPITPATCEEPGLERRVNTLDPEKTEDREIPALGHDYGEWEVVIPASYEAPGLEQRVCAHDKAHVETREIPVLPIVWGEWEPITPATCEEPGLERRVNTLDPEKTEDREIPALGHQAGEWVVQKLPTFSELGIRQLLCAIDGYVIKQEAIPIQALPAQTSSRIGIEGWTFQIPGETEAWGSCRRIKLFLDGRQSFRLVDEEGTIFGQMHLELLDSQLTFSHAVSSPYQVVSARASLFADLKDLTNASRESLAAAAHPFGQPIDVDQDLEGKGDYYLYVDMQVERKAPDQLKLPQDDSGAGE